MLSAQEAEAALAKESVAAEDYQLQGVKGGNTDGMGEGNGRKNGGNSTFEDITDLQNDEFIVSAVYHVCLPSSFLTIMPVCLLIRVVLGGCDRLNMLGVGPRGVQGMLYASQA